MSIRIAMGLSALLSLAFPGASRAQGWAGVQSSEPAPMRVDGSRVEREAWAMGTRVGLVAEDSRPQAAERTAEAALREIERAEAMLSTWDSTTPLSRLNRTRSGERLALSPVLAALLAEVEGWAERTGRAFDPTVGPLVDAWGLRGPGRTPTDADLDRALAAVGRDAFGLDPSARPEHAVVRRHRDAWIDSGGFGKGAALRAIARRVERDAGLTDRVLVDLGGQLWVGPGGKSRRVAVAHPRHRHAPHTQLAVRGVSVATSGGSERPGHLLDPRSGRPAPDWGSVTVVHADPLAADVLATALFVMGPTEGARWARANEVAALFLVLGADGVVEPTWSPAMAPWLVSTDVPAAADLGASRKLLHHPTIERSMR